MAEQTAGVNLSDSILRCHSLYIHHKSKKVISRNTLEYVALKDYRQFMKELKEVYKVPTEEIELINLNTWGENRAKNILWLLNHGEIVEIP